MLFHVHYLKLPQLLTGPDSKVNLIAILTLYALTDSSFWFQTGPFTIVYIKGSQVILSK